MVRGWPPVSRHARPISGSSSRLSAGSDAASRAAPDAESGPTCLSTEGLPGLPGQHERVPAGDQQPGQPGRAGQARQHPGERRVLDGRFGRRARTGCRRSRPGRAGPAPGQGCDRGTGPAGDAQDRSVRPAAARARAPPRDAATGCRRSALARRARNVSAETSPVKATVRRPGSSRTARPAISAASADLPIPPAPCSTTPGRVRGEQVRAAAPALGGPDRRGRELPARPGSAGVTGREPPGSVNRPDGGNWRRTGPCAAGHLCRRALRRRDLRRRARRGGSGAAGTGASAAGGGPGCGAARPGMARRGTGGAHRHPLGSGPAGRRPAGGPGRDRATGIA